MSKLIGFIVGGIVSSVLGTGALASTETEALAAGQEIASSTAIPDSEQLEKGLQGLSWEQFRAVVSAIPKLKADVDAYGPLGWQYVQANYRTYRWRKNINKLHIDQKIHLASLIQEAREGARLSN